MSADRATQLALMFLSERRCTLDNFEAGPNEELIAELNRRDWAEREFLAMWLVGESGSGKSHLLQGACHAAVAAGATAAYLPPRLMAGGVDVLGGLGEFGLVAVDDFERWAGERPWEEALMHVYQQLFVNGGSLLIASRYRPQEITVRLADLGVAPARGARSFRFFRWTIPTGRVRSSIWPLNADSK